jgi:predicted dehydrogenase
MVAGAGLIGQEHIKRVLDVPGAALTGIVDVATKATEQADGLGAPWFPDLETMLEKDKPDGVVVGLPNQFHFAAGMTLVKHGVPMLMEKPVCDSVEEAVQFADAAGLADRDD